MRQKLTESLEAICKELFQTNVNIDLTRPDEQFGDYSTNVALQLSKKLNKNPREVAEQIVLSLKQKMSDEVEKITVDGPGFVNITVPARYLQTALNEKIIQAPGGIYGASEIGKGKTVINEFPSPNMAKPFSVGHIRSALQGWSVYKLMKLMGYTTVRDNHLGDFGTPFGKWVVGFLRYSNEEKLEADGIYELARIYIAITADIKAEKDRGENDIAGEVQSWLARLERNEPVATRYSQLFNKISIDHMHQVMGRLEIETDLELGESFFAPRAQQLVDELLEKGIAIESQGAVIVELDEYGIDTPIILRKANGAILYATTDLATIEYRQNKWHPDKVFIHTGQEQSFYFTQLKALAKKVGYRDNIVHLWHGIVDQISEDGKREKMSSRKGVILLEELLDKAEEHAKGQMKDGDDQDVRAVALGAIKFTDFTADRKRGVLFDWDVMFNLQGFSGPAVQYAAVRISSILEKAGEDSISLSDEYDWQTEKVLVNQLLDYPDLLLALHDTYEMHKLASYLYELARGLNRYYDEFRVLDSPEPMRSARLWLLKQVYEVLKYGLDILGIPVPKKM